MLFKERKSGNFKRSFVKIEASFGWFFIIKVLSARISVSCSASTELTFSIPDRSKGKERGKKKRVGEKAGRHSLQIKSSMSQLSTSTNIGKNVSQDFQTWVAQASLPHPYLGPDSAKLRHRQAVPSLFSKAKHLCTLLKRDRFKHMLEGKYGLKCFAESGP